MSKEQIIPPGRKVGALPYSPGIKANGMVYTAGQVSQDPATGELVGKGDMRAQTRQVIANLQQVLEAAGSDLSKLVKTTVFISDMSLFSQMNEVYAELIPDPRPARSTVQAPLATPDYWVEIEGIAAQ